MEGINQLEGSCVAARRHLLQHDAKSTASRLIGKQKQTESSGWMPLCGILGKGRHLQPKAGLSITAVTEGPGGPERAGGPRTRLLQSNKSKLGLTQNKRP